MKTRVFATAFALFLFILPIPGTIALRHALLLSLLLLIAWGGRGCLKAGVFDAGKAFGGFVWFSLLTAWMLVQATWVSEETRWAMKEMLGQWLPAGLAMVIGIGVVALAGKAQIGRRQLLGGFAAVLLAQLLFSLLATIPDFLASGAFPQGKTLLTAGKLELSYWNNLLLVFLAVDALARWLHRRSLSVLPTPLLGFGIAMVFVSNLAFGARNGVIGSLLMLGSLALLILWHERRRLGMARALGFVAGALALIVALGWANYRLDPRWASFEETARYAWQIDQHEAWLNPDQAPPLTLPSGKPVEMSAYLRISWIRAGIDLVADYPLGVGYGRNAFGHALRKTRDSGVGHAHSGLVDWTVGLGLPGLVIWCAFLVWMIAVGARRYFRANDPAGLILVFVVGGFFGRMLLDSINRDHMLILFFLICAMLLSLKDDAPGESGPTP